MPLVDRKSAKSKCLLCLNNVVLFNALKFCRKLCHNVRNLYFLWTVLFADTASDAAGGTTAKIGHGGVLIAGAVPLPVHKEGVVYFDEHRY